MLFKAGSKEKLAGKRSVHLDAVKFMIYTEEMGRREQNRRHSLLGSVVESMDLTLHPLPPKYCEIK